MSFLIHYIMEKRHSSLRRELKVNTNFNAIEKWHEIRSEVYKEYLEEFKRKIIYFYAIINTGCNQ